MLSTYQTNLLLKKLNNRIINGFISLQVQENRTQLENRQLAIQKFSAILKGIIMSQETVRTVTTQTKSFQRRRVESKKKRGKRK